MISGIVGFFVKTLTADGKYHLLKRENSDFFPAFLKSANQNFQKEMAPIAYLFLKFLTTKDVVT